MAESKIVNVEKEDTLIDFKQLWQLLKKNWKWYPISILFFLFIAAIYLWFTPTTVSVTGKMELIDKSKNGSSSLSTGMALLNSLPMGIGSTLGGSSIDAEKEVLMSNTLVSNVVRSLGVYTEYRLSKWGRKTLLYQNTPITVSLDSEHVKWFDEELPLTFHQIQLTVNKSNNGYEVKTLLIENKEKTKLPSKTFKTLPATIETMAGTLTLTENILPAKQAKTYEKDYTLKITVSPPSRVADGFITRLSLTPPSLTVNNMLNINLQDENILRALEFVNGFVDAYNKRANDEKNEEARKTDEFVNARLAKIDIELGTTDDAWENSKKQYQITTPEVDAEEALTKKSQYEAQLVGIETQIKIHDYLSDYINDLNNLFEYIPVGMMNNSPEAQTSTGISTLITMHNQLVNQRKDMLKSVSERSPQVQRITESIRELHPSIQLAMQRDREQLEIQKNALDREYYRYSGRIGTAPQMERVFTEIGRQREIKQAVYLLLLQKREEIAMDLANITDKGRLIDIVKVNVGSTKPNKKYVFAAALFLGLFIPIGVFILFLIFKTRIDDCKELMELTRLPLLVEITTFNCDDAIRNLRTNLLLNLNSGQKTILVASQNEGDGKTFIAQHLVDSFNAIGKKALYFNADLRKLEKGHPADILASENFAQQMANAKAGSDYVIIDSSALRQYPDAYQLAQFVDATIFVVKAGLTVKSDIESLNNDSRLPNPMLVFNKI